MEELNIPEMVNRQHVVKKMTPAARRTLKRNTHDAAWGRLRPKARIQGEGAGRRVIRVDAKGTTQACSHCGELVLKDLSVRSHNCPHCGLEMERDENAAVNILNRGLAILRAGNRPHPEEENASTALKNGKRHPMSQGAIAL